MFTLRSGRVPYTTWLQQQLLNESFGANIHVHPSAVPMAPGLAPQMVPMQPCGLMSPHPMHMPVGPVPQAVFQQQETVPTPPWRADTSPSFLAATNALCLQIMVLDTALCLRTLLLQKFQRRMTRTGGGMGRNTALGLAVPVPNKAVHTPGAMCAGRYALSSGLPR